MNILKLNNDYRLLVSMVFFIRYVEFKSNYSVTGVTLAGKRLENTWQIPFTRALEQNKLERTISAQFSIQAAEGNSTSSGWRRATKKDPMVMKFTQTDSIERVSSDWFLHWASVAPQCNVIPTGQK